MRRPRLRLFAFGGDVNGSTAIEFAIVANAFLMLLLGTGYLSVMLWHEANLNWAVQSGARLVALNSSVTQSDISTAVNNYLSSVGMGSATVHYSTSTAGGVTVGTINASKSEQFVVPLFNTYNLTLTASANVPVP